MKCKKMIALLLLITSVLMLVAGCQERKVDYSLRQGQDNIEKVEICTYDDLTKTRTPIKELAESEYQQLITEFLEMSCVQYSPGDHPRDYGSILFCIYYNDREIEVIGQTNIGWISTDGTWHLTKNTFDWAEMKALIQRYVPEEYQPEWVSP